MDPKELQNAAGKPASLKMADTGPSIEEQEDAAMDELLAGNQPAGEPEAGDGPRGPSLQDGLMAAAKAADQQRQVTQEADEPPAPEDLTLSEQVFLGRSGLSPEQVETVKGMSPEQRAILWSRLEQPGGFQRQQSPYGQQNPYQSQQGYQGQWNGPVTGFGPGQRPLPTQQGGFPPSYQQQPQYGQQQGYQPQQAAQQPGYPQVDQRQLQTLADQMGVDASTLQGLTQYQLEQASARFQQYQQQSEHRFDQMQQQVEYMRQQAERQEIDAAMNAAHSTASQRYPQLADRNEFNRLALMPETAALARSIQQTHGVPLGQAVAAAVETMAAPHLNQQMGRTTQQQLHNNARRARNTAERTPQVGRAPAPPALRDGREGVDDFVEKLLREGAFDQRAG